MDKSIFDWYEAKAKEVNVDPDDVIFRGKYVHPTYYSYDHIVFEGMAFYKKAPHTRGYKCFINSNEGSNSPFVRIIQSSDNKLATLSELIGEHKYKAFKFLTAKHFVTEENNRYYLISPNLLAGDYQTYSYFDLVRGNRVRSYIKPTQATVSHSFGEVLSNKDLYLEYMTEHCYDQYVTFILNRIFEFSDDDHLSNVILVKPRNAKKFEEMFICDKESTAFNFMLASGAKFEDIKKALLNFDRYEGVVIGSREADNFTVQTDRLKKLFDSGLMGKFHLEVMKTIANLDYDKLSEKALEGTDIRPSKTQIDLYKYGSELAGEMVERIK